MSIESVGIRFGKEFSERDLRIALLRLNPGLNFDPASKLGYQHPSMHRFQGVWLGERHVGSMDRGPMIPEVDVWSIVTMKDGTKHQHKVIQIGWRTTVRHLVESNVPGVTYQNACRVLGVGMEPSINIPPPQKDFQYWEIP